MNSTYSELLCDLKEDVVDNK